MGSDRCYLQPGTLIFNRNSLLRRFPIIDHYLLKSFSVVRKYLVGPRGVGRGGKALGLPAWPPGFEPSKPPRKSLGQPGVFPALWVHKVDFPGSGVSLVRSSTTSGDIKKKKNHIVELVKKNPFMHACIMPLRE